MRPPCSDPMIATARYLATSLSTDTRPANLLAQHLPTTVGVPITWLQPVAAGFKLLILAVWGFALDQPNRSCVTDHELSNLKLLAV